MNLLAAVIGKNASAEIASASYNWVPMECAQFLWMLSTLHSNELYWAVSKLSFTVSLSNMSMYKNSQIGMQCLTDLIFLLVDLESILENLQSALV